MPYISEGDREFFRKDLNSLLALFDDVEISPGDLNYLITKILNEYIKVSGKNYSTLNGVIGVLECAKQEMYRRTITPYEDEKIEENGDL